MKIKLNRSKVLDGNTAKAPSASQLDYGEIAVNYSATDPTLFIKDSVDTVIKIASPSAFIKVNDEGVEQNITGGGGLNVDSSISVGSASNINLLSTGIAYFQKVGIGVTDPTAQLEIVGITNVDGLQTTERTITASTFDLSTGNHWTCAGITIPAPTGAVQGTSGLIRITAGPVVWNSVFKFPGGTAPTINSYPSIIPFYVKDVDNILMGNVVEGIS